MLKKDYTIKKNIAIPKKNEEKYLRAIENYEKVNQRIRPFLPQKTHIINSQNDCWETYI